jgi:glucokinase
VSELVAADIGGTHCRFAIATRHDDGRIALSHEAKLKVADHASLQTAFEAYRDGLGRTAPRHAAIAVAAPVEGELLKLTNNPWVIRPAHVAERLGLESTMLVNDFAAVAHAVAACGPQDFAAVAGPEAGIPAAGVVSVIGPGTGLGVAMLLTGARPRVVATEGGHIDFAPLDSLEDMVLGQLRAQFRRVSVERVVAGPGLANILSALAAIEGRALPSRDDKALWEAALIEKDPLAEAAFDRWCLALGSVVGDLALAQGAEAVVLAGGMLPRVQHLLPQSGFHARFIAKGRFEARMAAIPILRITHSEPGLLGAASAWFESKAE